VLVTGADDLEAFVRPVSDLSGRLSGMIGFHKDAFQLGKFLNITPRDERQCAGVDNN
jgi:hypothetical protein